MVACGYISICSSAAMNHLHVQRAKHLQMKRVWKLFRNHSNEGL